MIDRDSLNTLVAEVGQGDRAAFARLYDATCRAVVGFVHRLVYDVQDAESVAQEAYVSVWRMAPRFDPSRSSAMTWIMLIARSRAIEHLRAKASHTQRLLAFAQSRAALSAESETPDDAVERGEAGNRVREAMATLSPDQRLAVEMAFFKGLSHSEIAAATGIPLGTIKTRIRTAIALLQRELGDAILD